MYDRENIEYISPNPFMGYTSVSFILDTGYSELYFSNRPNEVY